MTEEQALAVVHRGLVSEESLPVLLREGKGLDRALLADVMAALRVLKTVYARREMVPKRLAYAFIDLTASLSAASGRYSDDAWAAIQPVCDELLKLAYEIVDWGESSA